MTNGKRLYEEVGDMPGAIAEFEAAYAVSPRAAALINLSLCYRKLPKTIDVLERALKESTAMSAPDRAETVQKVTELRAMLAFVTITVEPKTATVTLDGEALSPEALLSPVPVSPGVHRIVASSVERVPGIADVSVLSGETKAVPLTLTDLFGTLRIVTNSPDTKIEVDGKVVGTGVWQGRVRNGPRIVRAIGETDSGPVLIESGKTTVADLQKSPDVLPSIPPKDYRAAYVSISGAALIPTEHPKIFGQRRFNDTTGASSGGFFGARAGYRLSEYAGLEGMLEYGGISGPKNGAGEYSYVLRSAHLGALLRTFSPGDRVRFVGTVGGGAAMHFIEYGGNFVADDLKCRDDPSCASFGVDWFLINEVGGEVAIVEGMFLGVSLAFYLTGTSGVDDVTDADLTSDSREPYRNRVLPLLGPRLYIGYGFW